MVALFAFDVEELDKLVSWIRCLNFSCSNPSVYRVMGMEYFDMVFSGPSATQKRRSNSFSSGPILASASRITSRIRAVEMSKPSN